MDYQITYLLERLVRIPEPDEANALMAVKAAKMLGHLLVGFSKPGFGRDVKREFREKCPHFMDYIVSRLGEDSECVEILRELRRLVAGDIDAEAT